MSKLARLEKVDLRDQWKDEAKDFTPWLAEPENIEILSEAIGMDLEVIGKEEKVGSFSADILCKDINTNRNVVIENQLEQTDHTHLGQVITYCAGLEASTFIWISSQVREEHRAAVDWLNAITSDDYHFFAIEVQLFRIGDRRVRLRLCRSQAESHYQSRLPAPSQGRKNRKDTQIVRNCAKLSCIFQRVMLSY